MEGELFFACCNVPTFIYDVNFFCDFFLLRFKTGFLAGAEPDSELECVMPLNRVPNALWRAEGSKTEIAATGGRLNAGNGSSSIP